MDGILGISPGTRTVGIAVYINSNLVHWQIKVFKGKWSDRKCHSIITAIGKVIERYGVSCVVCKTIEPCHQSEPLNDLLIAVSRMLRDRKIRFVPCFLLEDIMEIAMPSGQTLTKEFLADYLIVRYPELNTELTKERLNRHPYYIKLFEAIAAVELYKRRR